MLRLTARQVHLDFHTSPDIEGIGSRYSKENFQAALLLGELSSITIFAKCHHGYTYYPSAVGVTHPHLDFDLTGAMLRDAHEIGVKAPIYITAGWCALDADNHPEWRAKDKDGNYIGKETPPSANDDTPLPFGSWVNLCLNDGSYAEHIYATTSEICERYENIDGLFFDIVFMGNACWCDECVAGMKAMGLNPESDEDARQYYIIKRNAFMRKNREILHERHPLASCFFNGGAEQDRPQYHDNQTHFELEDLPTTWGGYDKMPTRAKYFAKSGKDYLGMTGKFHTSWGEFGGFKLPEALRFEVASMLSYGARCSIGDQMHPDGEMDLETYRTIGHAYRYIRPLESYCYDTIPTTTLGLYLSGNSAADEGMAKILLESQNDFDIVYNDDYDRFATVIFPDCVKLNDNAKHKLNAFLARGGKAIITGDSLIESDGFIIDTGATYIGKSQFEEDYIVAHKPLADDMITSPILAYGAANKITATSGKVLASTLQPYFKRTYGHYCSHRNTPYDRNGENAPAAVQSASGNVIYFAHKLATMYYEYGSSYHRQYFVNALNLLNTNKVLDISLMSAGRATLNKQPQHNRYVLNMLYASPIMRNNVEVIEDMPPLYNIPVTIRVTERIKRIHLPTKYQDIPFTQSFGETTFTLPTLRCHEIVSIEY